MSSFSSGALVVYHGRSAVVSAVSKDKIEIRIEGGSSKSVRAKDIEFLHPGPAGALPPPRLPVPDTGELLELMEGETLGFGEFVELAYSTRSASAYWSAYQLLCEGTYFTGSPESGVKARPAADIEAALEAVRQREEKQKLRGELLERIRDGKLLPEDRPAMREIEQIALGQTESSRLLKDLDIEATPPKAHALLLALGVWDEFVNPWPARMGVDTVDPALPMGVLPTEERLDLTGMAALAIDDEGSNDPDDAISFSDGLLWVHVADPAALVTPGSALDDEAMNRGENLYLPESLTHMLPVEATEIFGLGLQPESPAMSFAVRITDDGTAVLEKMVLSTVHVERLTYAGAAERWNDSPIAELRPLLEKFKERRRADGALFIDLPEVKIKVAGREVSITRLGLTAERELVANAMLAAGSAVARYAEEHGFALPFATQVPPDAIELPDGALPTLAGMYALRKSCPPSVVQTIPAAHSGLGLNPYARLTSPLRRYGDLLAHQQLRRVIKGEEPFPMEYLDSRLATAEREALTRRRLERQSNEFWTQVYFLGRPDWSGEAVMVFRQDDRLTYLISELACEFKNRFGGKIALGETVTVRLVRSDPAAGTATFRIE